MGLAVPAALTVGIGRAAQLGILIKNGEALERLTAIRNFALDKTGTLTEGHPRILSATFAPDTSIQDQRHSLELAAALERNSEHPLARAVLDYVQATQSLPLKEIKTIPGQGITAVYEGQPVAIGDTFSGEAIPQTSTYPGTQLHLSVNHRHVLTLEARDTLRTSAMTAIQALRVLKVTPHILTGDNSATAAAIAEALAIPSAQVHARLLPADKVRIIQELQQQAPTAMAGDGLNDAASLAQADAGIAISGEGSGTDLSREAADLVLLRPDLNLIHHSNPARAPNHTDDAPEPRLGCWL